MTEGRINQACEKWVHEFRRLEEFKKKIYEEVFCLFSTGYNQGLKTAQNALTILLTNLQALEFDSNNDEV